MLAADEESESSFRARPSVVDSATPLQAQIPGYSDTRIQYGTDQTSLRDERQEPRERVPERIGLSPRFNRAHAPPGESSDWPSQFGAFLLDV